jgi:hypothetical protein
LFRYTAAVAAMREAFGKENVVLVRTVRRCKQNSVDPWLERAWFQPLSLKRDILVSKFAFKCNLYRYSSGPFLPGFPQNQLVVGRCKLNAVDP